MRSTAAAYAAEKLLDWIDRVALARPCPWDPARRIVQDVWLEEKATLLPFPEQ